MSVSPQRHLEAVSVNCRPHRPVDSASNNWKKVLFLKFQPVYVFFLIKKIKQTKFIFFFLNPIHQLFSHNSRGWFLYIRDVWNIYRYLRTPEGLLIKTKMKGWKKLTVEIWSQNFYVMACLGLEVRQRLLTI